MKKFLFLVAAVLSIGCSSEQSCNSYRYHHESHHMISNAKENVSKDFMIDVNGSWEKENVFKGTIKEISYDEQTGEKLFVTSKGTFHITPNDFNLAEENGKPIYDKLYNGESTGYNKDNQLVFKFKYKDGELNNQALEYYDDGNIEFRGDYKNGKLNGTHIRYYKNGNIMFREQYKDGILDGESVHYYEDGKIKSKMTLKNGRIIGDEIKYDKKGNVIK